MPKYTQPKKTFCYTQEFKIRAVKLSYQEGIQVKDVAEGLGIHPFMLSRWRKEYRDGQLQGDGQRRIGMVRRKKMPNESELSELKKLRKENDRLKKENDLLKKWQQFLADQRQSAIDSSRSTEQDSE